MNLEEIKRLAKAATPGPWEAVRRNRQHADVFGEDANKTVVLYGKYTTPTDAAYIAAVSPETVLALIARVREAEESRRRAETILLDAYRGWSEDAYAAGFMSPFPDIVGRFRKWLLDEEESEHRPPSRDYEHQMLTELYRQHEAGR